MPPTPSPGPRRPSRCRPLPPGGSTDTLARALAPKLQEKLGQSFIVDNRAGATGTIGATQVKRSAPDGYTFAVTSLGLLVIAPHLLKNTAYDAGKTSTC